MKIIVAISFALVMGGLCSAQQKHLPRHRAKAPAASAVRPAVDPGVVSGRTYTNRTLGFELTFPDTWLIPDSDFEEYMKKAGFDLSLKAPDSLPTASRKKIDQAIKQVDILLTAYRSMPGSPKNAIVRISIEDLKNYPQIKDAVDYMDAIRASFASIRLPKDLKYSETQAEKLGSMQFAYLDTTNRAGKKRMYSSVRNGFALMFTISYIDDTDLQTFRQILEQGIFDLK
jgi:hypothetical protein